MRIDQLGLAAAAVLFCGGCHGFHTIGSDCHAPQEYQRAVQVTPLKVPSGLDAPNVQGALVIPTVEAAPPVPGPKDACLDDPPRFKPQAPPKPASG